MLAPGPGQERDSQAVADQSERGGLVGGLKGNLTRQPQLGEGPVDH